LRKLHNQYRHDEESSLANMRLGSRDNEVAFARPTADKAESRINQETQYGSHQFIGMARWDKTNPTSLVRQGDNSLEN
jgi:hypothetical protein